MFVSPWTLSYTRLYSGRIGLPNVILVFNLRDAPNECIGQSFSWPHVWTCSATGPEGR